MNKRSAGFGLVETVIGVALFSVLALVMYQVYIKAFQVSERARARTAMTTVASQEIEKIRNLPYAQIGVQLGIPAGNLLPTRTITRGTYQFEIRTTVRNIDDPFDGELGSTTNNDLSPADSKLVEISVGCLNCKYTIAPVVVTTRIGPKNLESASTNGALFIEVLNASGLPVEGAQVHIVNASSSIVIDDVTNASGRLQIIDAPPGTQAYQVTATKPGYTTERTYATGSSTAPNPLKVNPTVLVQEVTELTLTIDQASTINMNSVLSNCTPVPSVDFTLTGTRLLSSLPDVLKYDQNHTTGSDGQLSLTGLEWDVYSLTMTNPSYDLAGTLPLAPFNLLPGSNQNFYLVLSPKDPNSVVVSVKDGGSSLPLADARVDLTRTATGITTTLYTGRGSLRQTDWSGLGNVATTTNNGTTYWYDDGSIDPTTIPGTVTLLNEFGSYRSSGWFESSTFDTGSASNFYELTMLPLTQSAEVGIPSIRLQFATGNSGTATSGWSYLGPDGTNASYYTATNTVISSVHNGDRYFRYRAYFDTASTSYTPALEEVAVTYTSNCMPSGQAFFDDLTAGLYDVVVTKSGYTVATDTVNISSGWQQKQILMYP